MERPILGFDVVRAGLGPFDEMDFLGKGSFAETYRVVKAGDEYALKVVHSEELPDFRLRREIVALQLVDHPNVMGFRDSGGFTAEGREIPYIECEYVTGGDVGGRIRDGVRPTSEDEVRAFLTGLLAGAHEIHDLGILHRDIKPRNVCLRGGDWGKPVLLDFGTARVSDLSAHTRYPTLIGTTRYMAPEQLRQKPARQRSDLFSIGVVVYEAATGTHPFVVPGIETVDELLDQMRSVQPPDPRELCDAFADDTATVVLRLMSFWGHERLGVDEALRDLENL